jgi:hypothetical protein
MLYLVDNGRLVRVQAATPRDAAQLAVLETDRGQMPLPGFFPPIAVYEMETWQCWTLAGNGEETAT